MVLPIADFHYHGLSTLHKEQTGLACYAVLCPSASSDGENVLIGIIRRLNNRTTKIVIYNIKRNNFYEISFEDAMVGYDFEGSLPALNFEEIYESYYRLYSITRKDNTVATIQYDLAYNENENSLATRKTRTKTTKPIEDEQVKELKSQLKQTERQLESLEKQKEKDKEKAETKRKELDSSLKSFTNENKRLRQSLTAKETQLIEMETQRSSSAFNSVSIPASVISKTSSISDVRGDRFNKIDRQESEQLVDLKLKSVAQVTELHMIRSQQEREEAQRKAQQDKDEQHRMQEIAERNAQRILEAADRNAQRLQDAETRDAFLAAMVKIAAPSSK